MQGENFADKKNVLKIELVFELLRESEDEMLDLDEVETLIANQIYHGYLKANIIHDKRLLVVPPNPFPVKDGSAPAGN